MSTDILQEALSILETKRPIERHSYFQLQFFHLGKEPSTQAQLWACLGEIKLKSEAIKNLNLEIAETEDNIALGLIKIRKLQLRKSTVPVTPQDLEENYLEIQEIDIAVRKFQRKLAALESSLADLQTRRTHQEEELSFFLEKFKMLEKKEPLKHFDDFESQCEFWNERLTMELMLRLALPASVDTELSKTILAMPDESAVKKQLVGILTHNQKMLSEVIKKDLQLINKPKDNNAD